jgi:hypothetical protein
MMMRSGGRRFDSVAGCSVAEKLPQSSVCCHNFNFNLGFFDSLIFDFCLDGAQEIKGGGQTDPNLIRRFFDFLIYVWTGSHFCDEIKSQN